MPLACVKLTCNESTHCICLCDTKTEGTLLKEEGNQWGMVVKVHMGKIQ